MTRAVVVRHARWAAVTAGEYDRRTRCITVNETVVDQVARSEGVPPARVRAAIVAHERAHAQAPPGLARVADERQARAAAVAATDEGVVAAIDRAMRKTGTCRSC